MHEPADISTRSPTRNPLLLVWRRVILEPFDRVEAESRAHMASDAGLRANRKVITIFVVSAICLTLLEYVGMSNRFGTLARFLEMIGLDAAADGLELWMSDQLHRLTYWAVACVVFYFVVPALVVKLIFRESLASYGLGFRGVFRDWWIYVVFFGCVAPAIFVVSYDAHFQSTYPFYDMSVGESLWPRLWIWEGLYFLQFFALEFFFRGFMVHGLRSRLGYYAVFAMMVPYCMIHFGKPMPETFGAIIAGIVLGSLSLKTRSIWLGVAIHASVALSMDFTSLWQKGFLF